MKIVKINTQIILCKLHFNNFNRDISPRKLFDGESSLISPIKDFHFRDTPLKNEFGNSPLMNLDMKMDTPNESIFIFFLIYYYFFRIKWIFFF